MVWVIRTSLPGSTTVCRSAQPAVLSRRSEVDTDLHSCNIIDFHHADAPHTGNVGSAGHSVPRLQIWPIGRGERKVTSHAIQADEGLGAHGWLRPCSQQAPARTRGEAILLCGNKSIVGHARRPEALCPTAPGGRLQSSLALTAFSCSTARTAGKCKAGKDEGNLSPS